MKKVILALFVFSSGLLTALNSSANETPPAAKLDLDAFTMMPMIRSVSVSPDGKKISDLTCYE
jgi:hypothetical protein